MLYFPAGVQTLVARADSAQESLHQKVHRVLAVQQRPQPLLPSGGGGGGGGGGGVTTAVAVEVAEELEAVRLDAELQSNPVYRVTQ